MTYNPALQLKVFQEGQLAFFDQTQNPYSDWRAGTWLKGFQHAAQYEAACQADAAKPRDPEPEKAPVNAMDFSDILDEWMRLRSDGERYSLRGEQLSDELNRRFPANREARTEDPHG